MQFSVEEFRPQNPLVEIAQREIELSLITLHIDARFKEQFGGIDKIYSEITKNGARLFDAVWILLIDKSIYGYSKEKFKEEILSAGDTFNFSRNLTNAINTCIAHSMPLIKNKKMQDDFNKINQAAGNENAKPCYGKYYDKLAKRYGYSIDQFFNLTLRQLHILLNVINDESYKEIEVQAALLGRKLKPKLEAMELTEDQDKKLDNEAQDAYARLKREYEERKAAKNE